MNSAPGCPKCGSPRVLPDVRVLDRDEYGTRSLTARFFRHPKALVFKGAEDAELRARVCCGCGYTELYAKDPRALDRAAVEAGLLPVTPEG